MKPFAISESHLTHIGSFSEAKKDYKPENNGPGLSRTTLTASACVKLYNISKMHAFPMFQHQKKKNGPGPPVITALSFSPFHFDLIPRGLCVCIRSGSTFPRFPSIGFFVLGFSYRATHISFVFQLCVRTTCDSLIYSASVSIKEFFNKAFLV